MKKQISKFQVEKKLPFIQASRLEGRVKNYGISPIKKPKGSGKKKK